MTDKNCIWLCVTASVTAGGNAALDLVSVECKETVLKEVYN